MEYLQIDSSKDVLAATLLRVCRLLCTCRYVSNYVMKILLYVVVCERPFYFKYLNQARVYAYNGMIQSTSTLIRTKLIVEDSFNNDCALTDDIDEAV